MDNDVELEGAEGGVLPEAQEGEVKVFPGKNASDGDIAQVETNVDELPVKDITVVKSVSKYCRTQEISL